jgi:hypothetical protein
MAIKENIPVNMKKTADAGTKSHRCIVRACLTYGSIPFEPLVLTHQRKIDEDIKVIHETMEITTPTFVYTGADVSGLTRA